VRRNGCKNLEIGSVSRSENARSYEQVYVFTALPTLGQNNAE
jgi:hypothetical protein